ncbi:PREDICTED: exosome component 10 [Rhagoletis zephyria]|uniref:exosome component 10 n=1 Tax=Rhagoletis zephyria TaxID=28612 RepID=UPI000811A7AA|nr:PREDICTED: exosome component 10 [Rhagoletis zephyria]
MAPTEAAEVAEETCAPETGTQKKAPNGTPLGNFASVEEFAKNGLVEIVEATKAANSFPQGAARDLYSAYPTFGRIVDEQSDRILGLISNVLKWQNVKGNIQRRQQDEQFEMLLECNDAIMERLNSNLDELAGIKKNPQTIVVESHLNVASGKPASGSGAGSWNLKKNETSPVAARLITAKNIARPQLKFKVAVDNSALTPFIPRIKDKPNSLKPLAVLPEYDEHGNIISYLHPYEFELMKLQIPASQLKPSNPVMPAKMDETELLYVDTIPKLNTAVEELRQHREIAIDVEHHSYRTFQGFSCLVQISTREKDYLFDALELRDEMHILNIVLTDPKIVKIFHGADMDIEWLQRDLSLYVVNMFDTHQGAKALNYARLSLSYLLKHYCDIEVDKTFQLADWRIRPLPNELVSYARQDTHYLIYIFDRITNDLLEAGSRQTNLLLNIYQRSTEICKKRYVKPHVTADSHMDIYRKSKRIFDNRQLYALREVFQWRDSVARQEDESYGYVLPNHMILQISESLPREMQGILACCNPIPPLVRQNLHVLHQIVLRAREQPLVKPVFETETIHRVVSTNTKDYNSKLYCPHDLSHNEEFRDDLPTLLSFRNNPILPSPAEVNVRLAKPVLSIYETPEPSDEDEDQRKQKQLYSNIKFVSPYQRYLAVLPLVEKEKAEEAARIEAENKKRQLCPAANPLLAKTEMEIKVESADDEYSLPIKEILKRTHEEAIAKKSKAMDPEEPKAKRFKTVTPIDDKLKFVNLPPTKRELQANKHAANNTEISTADTKTKQSAASNTANESSNSVHTISDDSDSAPEEMPSTSQAHTQQRVPHPQIGKKKFKNKNMKNRQKSNQSSNKPIDVVKSFDYKNVDFKKFQGGAQRAKGMELKPQFHGKSNSNKANNKKFNKLFTFSNVRGKK